MNEKEMLQLYFRATVAMAAIIGRLAKPGTTTEERDALGSIALGICFDLPPVASERKVGRKRKDRK